MAFYFNFFLLLSSWTCVYSIPEFSTLSERPSCNQTLSSLQELREATRNEVTQSTDYVLCVDLTRTSATLEYLGYFTTEIEYVSVIITGNSSVVKCETPPSEELPLSDYTKFPLVFTNSSLVIIESVRFEGCMRPIQFKWVTRVELISSSFR